MGNDSEMEYVDDMNNIALGVRDRLDALNYHLMTQIVINKTTDIARFMDIPEDKIKEWASNEKKRIERNSALSSLLEKLSLSPLNDI